jgi:hypothetical protein
MDQKKIYQIVVTSSALFRFQETILNYLINNFSTSRVIEIEHKIYKKIETLNSFPLKGTNENIFNKSGVLFKSLLFKKTRNLELKIIYFIDEANQKVYVTDFFPTLMHQSKKNKP